MDSVARPQGAGFDIGPYEWMPAAGNVEPGLGNDRALNAGPGTFLTITGCGNALRQNCSIAGGHSRIYDIRGRLIHTIETGQMQGIESHGAIRIWVLSSGQIG